MDQLEQKHCVPCEGEIPPMVQEDVQKYLVQVLGWGLIENGRKIERKLKFNDFREAINFINQVAELAEGERHHPDLFISWNCVTLTLWTHAIGGLSENDFIMAAKINQIHGTS